MPETRKKKHRAPRPNRHSSGGSGRKPAWMSNTKPGTKRLVKKVRARPQTYKETQAGADQLDRLFNRIFQPFVPRKDEKDEGTLKLLQKLNQRFGRGDSRR